MKKLLALTLAVLCLLSLCACGNDVTENPLITVPETDDPLYVSDRGILHVEGAFVVKANFLVDEGGGNYQPRTEGGISLPAVSLSPQTTGLTVGQLRPVLHGLLDIIPRQFETQGYILTFVPLGGTSEAPDYTWSISGKTLTEGKSDTVDASLGSFVIDDGDELAHIHLAP